MFTRDPIKMFEFIDPIDWEEHNKIPVKERLRILPQTVEIMHDYTIERASRKYYSGKKAIGYWHFRRFLILNEKYQEAEAMGDQSEMDYYYKLFMAYKDRQENNYGKYSPSVHNRKHKFRNTYEKKYSNKDKEENAEG